MNVRDLLRSPTSALALGLAANGAATYGFLLIAGNALSESEYAPLGALWSLVFLVCAGLFFPVEQELARAVAARRQRGVGVRPVIAKALALVAILVAGTIIVGTAALPFLSQLFGGNVVLVVALVPAAIGIGLMYLFRGAFSGTGGLRRYAFLLGFEGVMRCVIALGLAIGGVEAVEAYALVFALTPFLVLLCALPAMVRLATSGPAAPWADLTPGLGRLIVGSVAAQALLNLPPVLATYLLPASRQDEAGAVAKAMIITRIPLFLFQGVQAVLLPRFTTLATAGEWIAFSQLQRRALVAVSGLALAGVAGFAALGSWFMILFGSPAGLPTVDFVLLGLGNGCVLVAMTGTQALIAIQKQGATTVAWVMGLLAFGLCMLVPVEIVRRVELALLLGGAVSAIAMVVVAENYVRRASRQPPSVTPTGEVDLSRSSIQ